MSAPTAAQIRETRKPHVVPTARITAKPIAQPTVKPIAQPTVKPTVQPTAKPAAPPTAMQVRHQRSIAPCARMIRNQCAEDVCEGPKPAPSTAHPIKCEPAASRPNPTPASFESIYTRNCYGRFDELDEYKML